ncbi:PaaI family thioesterase [Desulfovibrio sp. OttesenSCG-928-O18]|nr:PaaI family thioesterase [Desulfovibrio sp. OttesenSCG-928-O18]
MKNAYLMALCQAEQNVNPLFNLLGAKLVEAENGRARIDLPLSPCLAQGMGVVAGGILATLADEAMAHAVISMLGEGKFMVTTEMNIRYLRASNPQRDGMLSGTGVVVKPGRSIFTTSAEIVDEAGRLLATAGGSFFVTDPPREKA